MEKLSQTPPSLTTPPTGYTEWLAELKTRIQSAQQRAALAVNRELVLLYWQIGRDILARQGDRAPGPRPSYDISRHGGLFAR